MTDFDRAEIRDRFVYHPPTDGQPEAYEQIRAAAREMAEMLILLCPFSRESSLALTHLDEVVMFANASIARHGLRGVDL